VYLRYYRTFTGLGLVAFSLTVLSAASLTALIARAAAPPAPVPNGPAFVENFDDPKLANWITSGTTKVAGGKLILGNPNDNRENGFVYAKPKKNAPDKDYTVYGNVRIEARARLVSKPALWGGYGIWFRTNGGGQFRNGDRNPEGGAGYVFNYVPGKGGVELLRRSHSMAFAGPLKPATIDNAWHTLRVDAVGPVITAYFDGAPVFKGVSPEKPFGYANGAVGMGIFNRGSVEVDWFRVTPLGSAPATAAPAAPVAVAVKVPGSNPVAVVGTPPR
jgi:hypothetical protein